MATVKSGTQSSRINTVDKLDGIENNIMGEDPSNQFTEHFPDGSFRNWSFEKGNEHMTMYHKSGSSIQITPDGSLKFVSAAGQMGFECFGNGYMRVTGAHEVIVDGDASMKVAGKTDWTLTGDVNMTTESALNLNAKEMNLSATDHIHLGSTDITLKSGDAMVLASARIDLNPTS